MIFSVFCCCFPQRDPHVIVKLSAKFKGGQLAQACCISLAGDNKKDKGGNETQQSAVSHGQMTRKVQG